MDRTEKRVSQLEFSSSCDEPIVLFLGVFIMFVTELQWSLLAVDCSEILRQFGQADRQRSVLLVAAGDRSIAVKPRHDPLFR